LSIIIHSHVEAGVTLLWCFLAGDQFIQRDVTVRRNDNGYGLLIRGKSPQYFISSVKNGGAAAAAGITAGEHLIKVRSRRAIDGLV
jgi:predicted metalloprotease with PDZ domain